MSGERRSRVTGQGRGPKIGCAGILSPADGPGPAPRRSSVRFRPTPNPKPACQWGKRAAALERRRGGRGKRSAHQPHRAAAGPEGPDDRGNRIDSRPRGGNYGARYHGILEDRANFIEYVRGLDQGPPAAFGNGPGG